MLDEEKRLARERQGTRTDIVETFHEVEAGKARDRAAAYTGRSGCTFEIAVAEIRTRAERWLGELIAAQQMSVGLATGGQPYCSTGSAPTPVDRPPTLAPSSRHGSDAKKPSARAQELAAMTVASRSPILK